MILTVTRQCNLRCSYCPTVKEGWPSLSTDQAVGAVRLFAQRYGGGDIKLFGGEPLLVPDVVRAVFEEAAKHDSIRWVYLSTNGLGLDAEWVDFLQQYPKGILTISLDGKPSENRRFRRTLDETVPDAYDHIQSLLSDLLRTPRVVVTQTIPPAAASRAFENFEHLRALGFWRFNFLPGYYLPWNPEQLSALTESFDEMARVITSLWQKDERFYVRNLFTFAPTPFFNTGLVVDADGTIHPSNVGLSGQLDGLRGRTQVGDLVNPPTKQQLDQRAKEVSAMLEHELSEKIWASTMAVDRQLTRFCKQLYPVYGAYRKRRSAA